jgi:hypothetical protein
MEFNEYVNSLPKVKAAKMPPEEFFKLVVETEDTTKKFIKELLSPAVKGRSKFDMRTSYHCVMAAYTNADNLSVTKNQACNFTAFVAAILHKFRITKLELKALIEAGDEPIVQNPALKKPRRYGHNKEAGPKVKRPTAKAYFKEMTGSRNSMVAFIKEHLAPAVAGRTLHNVSGAYYGALAKNTCEVATSIVHNTACNYQAFKKKLGTYSISPEELSALLEVEVSYKPSKTTKNTTISKKEKALNVLRSKLDCYIADTEKLDLLVQSIYTELKPIMNKTK